MFSRHATACSLVLYESGGGSQPVEIPFPPEFRVGDVFAMDVGAAEPLRLRFVAALSDSVLQGELVMAEEQFVRLFPNAQGYRLFLVDAPGVEDAAGPTAELHRHGNKLYSRPVQVVDGNRNYVHASAREPQGPAR